MSFRSAAAPTVARSRSSLTAACERAPRLRKMADLIELQADRCAFPSRARRVARDMRTRAAELELGHSLGDEMEPSAEMLGMAA